MKILITGCNGFIGRNLISRLEKEISDLVIYRFDIENTISDLDFFCRDCDFVFNFAAVHRPSDPSEFSKVNFNQFQLLLSFLEKYNNRCPVLYTSSIQSNNGTLYGESKYNAEVALKEHANKMKSRGILYRLTNVFGRWARPNSHSVVATFCYNVLHDIPLFVSEPEKEMRFNYIDDVIDSFMMRISEGKEVLPTDSDFYFIDHEKDIKITLKELASLIENLKNPDFVPRNKTENYFLITFNSYKDE